MRDMGPWPDMLRGGEDQFLRRLAALAARRPLRRGMIGVGDDAALLPGNPRRVVTVDLLVEGQHFQLATTTPEDLAQRALEANLSDIAAMGARPEAAFVGLAWPATSRARAWVGRLMRAFMRRAAERGAPLLGGDTVRAAEGAAVLAVTVVGVPGLAARCFAPAGALATCWR